MAAALEVRNLSVRFGRNVVLRDLDFDVEAGSTLAVIGPNGAGKSVLFKALAGLIPYEGSVKWAPGVRLGYVPQKLDLERDLPVTGRDYLGAMAHVAGRARGDIEGAMKAVGLGAAMADTLIGALSGGAFQRLLVACALLVRPTALLLDEATSGIDEPGQELIQDVIHRLQAERSLTILQISHELRLVYGYADNALCLSRETVFFGPPEDVLTPEHLARLYGTPLRHHIHDHERDGH
jgi:zinc transport system ATP-binding protein